MQHFSASSTLTVIVLNVLSTTGVITSNKLLMGRERFPFIITGLCLNFCTTFMVLESSVRFGLFKPKGMPPRDRWLVAASAVLTILFNNASVEANSVGTYQISKLLIVPCIMVLERVRGIPRTYTPLMYLSLLLIAVGVGLTTVTDVELTWRGVAVASCSTVLTAHYQIWQGSKQHEHSLTSQQITHTVQVPQIALALPAALLLDVAMPSVKKPLLLPVLGLLDRVDAGSGSVSALGAAAADGQLRILSGPGGAPELVLNLFANNALAVAINLTSYFLISATSPVTYQVVGQLKTVLVVVIGYLCFDVPPPPGWLAARCFGMALAIGGVFAYGLLKTKANTQAKDKKG